MTDLLLEKIELRAHPISGHVSPHAIIHRKLAYFTEEPVTGSDALDEYKTARFNLIQGDTPSQRVSFDIRSYPGFPEDVVSIYLSDDVSSRDAAFYIDKIIDALSLPATAVTWKRGQPYEHGKVRRHPEDRLSGLDIHNIISNRKRFPFGMWATFEELKAKIEQFMSLTAHDLELDGEGLPNWVAIIAPGPK